MKKENPVIPHFPMEPGRMPLRSIPTDPQGSWTGVPEEPYEKPVQDADDL